MLDATVRLGDLIVAGTVIVSVALAYGRIDKRLALLELQMFQFGEWVNTVVEKGFVAAFNPKVKGRGAGGD